MPHPLVLAGLFQKTLYIDRELWQFPIDHGPNHIETNTEVVMNDFISQTCHLLPRYVGVGSASLPRDPLGGLTDYLEIAEYGVVSLGVVEEVFV